MTVVAHLNRVFMIDDEEIQNMVNKKIVEKTEICKEVTTYKNAESVIQYLKQLIVEQPDRLPDAIFVDINMPIMDGWEFLTAYQALNMPLYHHCRVFILSSSILASDIEKAKTFPFVEAFISKSLSPEVLSKYF
ncbi:MAG: response regulator [Chitinophagia bacterium]|nr:response regulator [Chitinophagia bacterium]